jgi:hypothetical protein
MQIVEPNSTPLEDKPPETGNGHSVDNSGFGLVNWLFDHIKDRRPIFLSLYQQYDEQVKFSANRYNGFAGGLILPICIIFDGIMFLMYMAAVVAIVTGITFIFVKGTGLLDYIHKAPTQVVDTPKVEIQTTNAGSSH